MFFRNDTQHTHTHTCQHNTHVLKYLLCFLPFRQFKMQLYYVQHLTFSNSPEDEVICFETSSLRNLVILGTIWRIVYHILLWSELKSMSAWEVWYSQKIYNDVDFGTTCSFEGQLKMPLKIFITIDPPVMKFKAYTYVQIYIQRICYAVNIR